MNAKTDDSITRFLLGELSDDERAQIEQRFLSDNEFFEEVLSAENALIDQYLLGQLSDEQRKRAELLFQSSPRQRREVSFTEQLIASLRGASPEGTQATHTAGDLAKETHAREEVTGESVPHNAKSEVHNSALIATLVGMKNFMSRFNWAGALALLLLCLTIAVWVFYQYSQKKRPAVDEVASERSNHEEREKVSEKDKGQTGTAEHPIIEPEKHATPEELVIQPPKHRLGGIASILLAPTTLERGGDSKVVKLRNETKRIQLQLEVDEDPRYEQYSVLISTFDGRNVWSKDSLGPGQIKKGRITFTLPASLLKYDDYRVELKGLSDGSEPIHIADYVFKVRD
jgi:anti-sigma-K factor RskA